MTRKNFFLLIFLVVCFQSFSIAQETTPKKSSPILTNEAFTTNTTSTTSTPTENPANTINKEEDKATKTEKTEKTEIIDPSLQFKMLDLMLSLAQEPENQLLRMQQIELNTQLRQAKLVQARDSDIRDLEFRKKYVNLRIAIINAQKQQQEAITKVQQERRKIVQGSQGSGAFTGVFQAQSQVEAFERQIIKLKLELDLLVSEGRRLGVGTRVFR